MCNVSECQQLCFALCCSWGLTRAPKHLVEELQQKIRDNIDNAPMEGKINVIETEMGARPLFIKNDELNAKILKELKPMHEEWSGVELEGAIAYGLRLYQNNSRLLMHVDKSNTHVISCILHIDRSEDAEPWPIVIEDFQGNTNEVYLANGDMLFYEVRGWDLKICCGLEIQYLYFACLSDLKN
jgi:hypothetical protein